MDDRDDWGKQVAELALRSALDQGGEQADWIRHQQRLARRRQRYQLNKGKLVMERKEVCVDFAEWYHLWMCKLYRSRHATVVYGRGGQEYHHWNSYQEKHRLGPTKWHNAGVRIDGDKVVLEDSRGEVVARLALYEVKGKIYRIGSYIVGRNQVTEKIPGREHYSVPKWLFADL